MPASLRLRLLLTLLVVLGVALGIVAISASRSTTSEFERTVAVILTYRDPRLESKINLMQKYIAQYSGDRSIWAGLQDLLESMGRSSKTRYVLAGLDGHIYGDSQGEWIGQTLDIRLSKPFAVFLIEGRPVLAYFEPLNPFSLQEVRAGFTQSVNRSLLLATLAAGALALVLTLVLSRSILAPVSALRAAARRMQDGDLSQRVVVRERGELGELAQAFNAMADSLQRMEGLRRKMVSDVAHELRTPLSNIRGHLEALQDGVLQPGPHVIASLHEEAMLLNRLVDDLQELALAEAGQLRLEPRPLALEPLVKQALTNLRPHAETHQLQLTSQLSPDLWAVLADPDRLAQVLRNLLENAIAHTPSGGRIAVKAWNSGRFVEVRVEDNGRGIEPQHLPYIFERFYRADPSRSRATGGAGLGLAIVKQLVEAMGGQVRAISRPGQGTAIMFTLPAAQSHPAAEAPPITIDQLSVISDQ